MSIVFKILIVLSILRFIFKFLKKNKKNITQNSTNYNEQEYDEYNEYNETNFDDKKDSSLQDLLNDFKSQMNPLKGKKAVINYEEEAMSAYNEVDYETNSYDGLVASDLKDQHLKPYKIKQTAKGLSNKKKSKYATMLQSKASMRDVVILNEVFNRKKF